MSYRHHSNNTISSIIDFYSSHHKNDNGENDEDDDVLRKSYSMPLSIQDYSSSPPSLSPMLSSNDTSSPQQPHLSSLSPSSMMRLRASKSEEQTATTATNILPQHKLDRYGFIVNMDVHGNIIASQRDKFMVPNDTASHTSNREEDAKQHPSNNITSTGAPPKSSSSYSMDTNYDKPTATKVTAPTRIAQQSSTVHRATTAAAAAAPPLENQLTTTTPGGRVKKYYMQRRTKPQSISEAARTARRITKWDTMLRFNIPNEVVLVQEQQEREEQQQRSTAIKLLQQPLYNRKQRRYNTMKRRLRKGIPNQHQRSMIWPILCNVATKMNASPPPGLYHTLLLQMTNHCYHEQQQENSTTTTTETTSPTTPGVASNVSTTGTTTSSASGRNNTTRDGTTNSSAVAANASSGLSNEVDDTTRIEMNYTNTSQSKVTTDGGNGNDIGKVVPPPPPIQFQYTKSFRSIQETIERDLHRTFPRHCMFYTTEVDDDEDDFGSRENYVTTGIDPINHDNINDVNHSSRHGNDSHPKIILGDMMSDDTEDQHSSDTREIQQRSICGTNEISNLIRELDLVPQMANHLMNQQPTMMTTPTKEDNDINIKHSDGLLTNHATPTLATTKARNDENSDLKSISMNGSKNDANHTTGSNGTLRSKSNPSGTNNHSDNHNNTTTNDANILDGVGGQSRLRRVLKAYSLYDREIGYCQGMNFIAAMFLTIVTEEYAFWMLVGKFLHVKQHSQFL